MALGSGRSSVFGKIFRWVFVTVLALAVAFAALLLVYRFTPPVSTLMLGRWITREPVDRRYVPLAHIAPNLVAAVIVSEDARFCRHNGVDWDALREVMDTAGANGPSRGASTITMQTAKNLFLWPSRSVLRKGIEIPLALLIDLAWPKRHVLEVYLNIAEWGDGTFGAEAAAQRYFHKPAADLDPREAALLATALPNPIRRNPAHARRRQMALAATVMARARDAEAWVDCVR
jgi:monofunctional biosynthetic peptidoglycan transglycosylase